MTDRAPYEDERELPVPEVGDLGSFKEEPQGGDPDALEPAVEDGMGEAIMDERITDVDLEAATASDEERNQ